jgi:hypothetical protein
MDWETGLLQQGQVGAQAGGGAGYPCPEILVGCRRLAGYRG